MFMHDGRVLNRMGHASSWSMLKILIFFGENIENVKRKKKALLIVSTEVGLAVRA
jgi:hypothetical protein